MNKIKALAVACLMALALAGCDAGKDRPVEPWQGATPGDNCMVKYQDPINQNRCNLQLQEG